MLTRRHSQSSNPRRIAVNLNLELWPLRPKTTSLVGHPKIILYTEFEHFGVIRFWVISQLLVWKTLTVTVTITWPFKPQNHGTSRISQSHSYAKFEHFGIIGFELVMLGLLVWKMHLLNLWPWLLTFQPKPRHFLDIPKWFPTPSLNSLGSFGFELCCGQTDKHTKRRTGIVTRAATFDITHSQIVLVY